MVLSIMNYTKIKVVQATHYQGNVRCGASRGMQCSYMSTMSVTWTLFRYLGLRDKFVLDCILGKGDHSFEFIG